MKYSTTALFLLLGYASQAQQVEWDKSLRESGKIYIVVIALLIIFIGLVVYLFLQDRRISKLEKSSNNTLK